MGLGRLLGLFRKQILPCQMYTGERITLERPVAKMSTAKRVVIEAMCYFSLFLRNTVRAQLCESCAEVGVRFETRRRHGGRGRGDVWAAASLLAAISPLGQAALALGAASGPIWTGSLAERKATTATLGKGLPPSRSRAKTL